MAADLFETYVVTIVATMLLAAIFFVDPAVRDRAMMLPLAIGAVCILTSVAGTYAVKLGAPTATSCRRCIKALAVTGALFSGGHRRGDGHHRGLQGASRSARWRLHHGHPADGLRGRWPALSPARWCGSPNTTPPPNYRPVRSIAQSSTTGHGTNVIQGLRGLDGSDRAARGGDLPGHPAVVPAERPVWHRDCGHHYARAGRHDRGSGCLRPGDGQRRWHCRNGRSTA